MASEWLEWEAKQRGITIRHQLNDTEKRIGERRLRVDGIHDQSRTVFQFQGMILPSVTHTNTSERVCSVTLNNFLKPDQFVFSIFTGCYCYE